MPNVLTREKIKEDWCETLKWFETRKAIFPTSVFLDTPGCLKEALKFEELNILSRKEIADQFMRLETDR
jgi:hypothetical protein